MQTIALSHHQQPHSGLALGGILKFVIPALFVALAVFELSLAHLILLALFSALVLAMMQQINKINAIDVNDHYTGVGGAGFDGGSFHQHQPKPVKTGAHPVIRDGGSFERAPLFSSTRV